MRKSLIGYYPPTDSELKQLWQTGLIVLDANVLLNLYRYSPTARDELLRLLDKLKDRLWIPYQVALEYHRNRLVLIRDERKLCEDFPKQFDKLVEELEQKRRHPFVSDSLQKQLNAMVEDLRNEIATNLARLDALRRNDPILDRITNMYEGRVGAMPDAAKHEVWAKEGEERYRRGVPPGFEDHKKAGEQKFGDLFLWMELLDHARSKKLPVLFVTDDVKKDWWREVGGETVGPHPALVAEIVAVTSKPFHMYKPERFVEVAGKEMSQPVSAAVVKEVREAQSAAQESVKTRMREMIAKLREQQSERERQDMLQAELAKEQEILRRQLGAALGLGSESDPELQAQAEDELFWLRERERHLLQQRDAEEFLRKQQQEIERSAPTLRGLEIWSRRLAERDRLMGKTRGDSPPPGPNSGS